jgi:hypothetical protein
VTPPWVKWLRAVARNPAEPAGPLPPVAALTGQDFRALAAIATCWELHFAGDGAAQRGAIEAVRSLLPAMQRQCWPFARALIAYAGDWTHVEQLWPRVTGRQRELVQ